MVTFWTSAGLRIVAVAEFTFRWSGFYTSSKLAESIDMLEIADGALVLGLLVIRFSLPLRFSILFNNLVFLRLVTRGYSYLVAEKAAINMEAKEQILETEREFLEMLGHIKRDKQTAEMQRDIVVKKLKVTMGYLVLTEVMNSLITNWRTMARLKLALGNPRGNRD
jgi:hypothetical protein